MRIIQRVIQQRNKSPFISGYWAIRESLQVILVVIFLLHPVWAESNTKPSVNPVGRSRINCNILQSLDSLKKLDTSFSTPSVQDSSTSYLNFPDLVYEIKIAMIDDLSPIDFIFNDHVKTYLQLYSQERREQVSQMLGLSKLYFPLFDEILDKHQLPLELKYLAVVESALNPLAVSTSGAVGLWQFKINTARMFDLEVNSYIDERMDPVKSTEAACLYLKYLYRIFNDWHLVMAAYNVGPGVVRNAISRGGGETNFWKLYDQLPEAAQNYVPAFIAAAYIMQNASAHKIEPVLPAALYLETDTVNISKPLSFTALTIETSIPFDLIRILNPVYRRGIVPKSVNGLSLRLPTAKIQTFLEKEERVYERTTEKVDFHNILAKAGTTENRIMVEHKVQAGDYLHKIAIRYNCTVDDINIWNPNISGDLAIGQGITIWVDKQTYDFMRQTPYEF